MQYLRGRYFQTPEEFKQAERQSGAFNILRRLDSDRSSERLQNLLLDKKGARVTLTRAKTSLWVQPRKSNNEHVVGKSFVCIGQVVTLLTILAILLVDPTVKEGCELWRGYRPFEDAPSMHATEPVQVPPRTSLFDDVVFWSSRMTKDDLAQIKDDPNCIAVPMLRLVLADWRMVLKYMATVLGKIEWEFENPHWGETPSDIDGSLRKLSPWRRNVPYYQTMITESIERIFSPALRASLTNSKASLPTPRSGVASLLVDFHCVQRLMDASQQRIGTIQTMATNAINIEESRRAVQQNKNLARLTFLATIFIPLNFTTSFLSMSPNFSAAKTTIWMFFLIGLPLTAFALVAVDLCHPQEGVLERWWRRLVPARKEQSEQVSQKVELGKTIKPWPGSQAG